MNGYAFNILSPQDDSEKVEMPRFQSLRKMLSWDNPRPQRWVVETTEDLEVCVIEHPDLVFPTGIVHQNEEWYQYHFNELFLGVQGLVDQVFGGGRHRNFYRAQSPWVPEYPEEFYEYVKAVAFPDSKTQHWENLLRSQEERKMLIGGIIWKALDSNVLSTLMFGASEEHERALSTHDEDLMDVEGFTRSTLLAQTNAAYLKDTPDYLPPHFWERVSKVSTQIVKMLLPLYNVCGTEFSDKPPSLEDFAQGTFNFVAYAGWLNLVNRLSSGVLNINWLSPDQIALQQDKIVSEDVFCSSLRLGKAMDQKSKKQIDREMRVKISAAPFIARLTFDDSRPDQHKMYVIQRPHIVCYSAREDEWWHMKLPDFLAIVRQPKKLPPTWLVLLILATAGALLSIVLSDARHQRALEQLLGGSA